MSYTKRTIVIILIVSIPAAISAVRIAAQDSPLAFEVASVRSSVPGRTITQASDMTASFSPDRFTAKNLRLLDLIDIAYRVQTWQVSGGPSWVDPGNTTTDRYDILAKAEREASRDELRLMLQTLLKDRFNLTLHRETKPGQTYELSIGRNGHKLQKLTTDDYERSDGTYSMGRLVANHMTMSDLSRALMGFLETPVADKTGLKGFFKFTLVWTPDLFRSRVGEGGTDGPRIDTNGPSLFTAVQEQLGLKLESTKGPVEVLVIDHVERPSGN